MPVRSDQGPDLGALRQVQDFFVSNFDGCGEAFSPGCTLEPFNNQLRAPDATCEKSTWFGWEMGDSPLMDVKGHWPDQPTPHATFTITVERRTKGSPNGSVKVVYVIRAWKNQDLYVEHHADGMSINILCEEFSTHEENFFQRLLEEICSCLPPSYIITGLE